MSFRTWSWLLPQKLQRYGTLGPFAVVVIAPDRQAPGARWRSPLLRRALALGRGRLGLGRARVATELPEILGQGDEGVVSGRVHLVDDAIRLGLPGSHEKVPVGVFGHSLEWLPRVVGKDLVVALD